VTSTPLCRSPARHRIKCHNPEAISPMPHRPRLDTVFGRPPMRFHVAWSPCGTCPFVRLDALMLPADRRGNTARSTDSPRSHAIEPNDQSRRLTPFGRHVNPGTSTPAPGPGWIGTTRTSRLHDWFNRPDAAMLPARPRRFLIHRRKTLPPSAPDAPQPRSPHGGPPKAGPVRSGLGTACRRHDRGPGNAARMRRHARPVLRHFRDGQYGIASPGSRVRDRRVVDRRVGPCVRARPRPGARGTGSGGTAARAS
jgi:hypothetical protein